MSIFDNDIEPRSAYTSVMVEEGHVELVINGYLFSFTVHQYSNGINEVLSDDFFKLKARKMLISLGVEFKKETGDEVHHDELVPYIIETYGMSNSHGGGFCSWTDDDITDYKEF